MSFRLFVIVTFIHSSVLLIVHSLPNLQVHWVRRESGHLFGDLGLEQHAAVEERQHLDGVSRVHVPHDVLHGLDELLLLLSAGSGK